MTRWSLGVFGDLLWDYFPELRPAIKDMICDDIQLRIDLEENLKQFGMYDINTHVVGPEVVAAIEENREGPTVVPRLAALIRATLAYDGPDQKQVHDGLALYLLESLDSEVSVAKLAAVDPGLVSEVRARWRGTWTD